MVMFCAGKSSFSVAEVMKVSNKIFNFQADYNRVSVCLFFFHPRSFVVRQSLIEI